jgi:hypothetical protein
MCRIILLFPVHFQTAVLMLCAGYFVDFPSNSLLFTVNLNALFWGRLFCYSDLSALCRDNVFAYSLIQSAFSVCGLDSLSRTEFVDCDLKILLFTMHFLLRS